MKVKVIMTPGDGPAFGRLIGRYFNDQPFLDLMLQEAGSRFEDPESKLWFIAIPDGVPILHTYPMAWGALIDGASLLTLTNSYHVPEHRNFDVFLLVHKARQAYVELSGKPGLTYVYEGPRRLLAADGWIVTAEGTDPDNGEDWFEMTYQK